ncbi:hypothetical protein ACQW5G_01180 [Fructilactobacillus sp. Tb1]|uniref:hypothetical protein n=1 Tax=Fructilactobacillus sp. Tb1 TaxID=3422304 RepID=UPI003D270E60
MRYCDLVSFHKLTNDVYNPDTGEYESGNDAKTDLYANVTDVGTNQQMQLFGALNTNTKTIRLRVSLPDEWQYLTINNQSQKYVLKTVINTQKGVSLIVGEQQ